MKNICMVLLVLFSECVLSPKENKVLNVIIHGEFFMIWAKVYPPLLSFGKWVTVRCGTNTQYNGYLFVFIGYIATMLCHNCGLKQCLVHLEPFHNLQIFQNG